MERGYSEWCGLLKKWIEGFVKKQLQVLEPAKQADSETFSFTLLLIATNLPTLTKFAQAEPRTDSDNAQISEKWYIK